LILPLFAAASAIDVMIDVSECRWAPCGLATLVASPRRSPPRMRTTAGSHEHVALEEVFQSPLPDTGSPVALAGNESWSTPTSSPHPPDNPADAQQPPPWPPQPALPRPPPPLEWHVAPGSPWSEIRREEVEELLPPSAVVLCAREEEARHMRDWLEGPVLHESKLGGQWRRSSGQLKGVSARVDVVVCGVGAINAAAAAAAVCCLGASHNSPVAVFNVGRAIGHHEELYTGDVVVGTRTVGLDIEPHRSDRDRSNSLSPVGRHDAAAEDRSRYGGVDSDSDALSPSSDGGLSLEPWSVERHRSVRRVDTDYGLLAAARVAVAAQRVGVVLEGVIGSTEAWATSRSDRLSALVRQHDMENESTLEDISVTDGEAHSAAVVCRRWGVPYVAVKEVLSSNPTEAGRQAAGGRAAELAVRILRTYLPIEYVDVAANGGNGNGNGGGGGSEAGESRASSVGPGSRGKLRGAPMLESPGHGPDPLTPPVSRHDATATAAAAAAAAGIDPAPPTERHRESSSTASRLSRATGVAARRVLKPRPLKFEGQAAPAAVHHMNMNESAASSSSSSSSSNDGHVDGRNSAASERSISSSHSGSAMGMFGSGGGGGSGNGKSPRSSGVVGVRSSGSGGAAAAAAADKRGWGSNSGRSGRGGRSSGWGGWGATAVGMVAALAFGCGIGFYLASSSAAIQTAGAGAGGDGGGAGGGGDGGPSLMALGSSSARAALAM
jgi:nucleoside phosphorylase